MNSSFYRSAIVFPDESIVSFLSVKVYQLRLEIRQQALTITLIPVASAIYSQILSCVHKVLLNTLYHSSPPKAIRRIKRKRSARERESGAATRRMCMWNDLEPLWNAGKNPRSTRSETRTACARSALKSCYKTDATMGRGKKFAVQKN